MALALEILTGILLVTGSFFVVVGGIGLLRMPDFYTRVHAASLTESLGAILIILGLIVHAGWGLAMIKLLIVLFFLLFTSPTAAYAIAHAARIAGQEPLTVKPKSRTGKESDHV